MLTRRKQDFINHYIITKNATKSAELSGYSPKTAYSQGSRLLKQVEVKDIINKKISELSEKLSINRENIESNLWNEANNAQRPADRIAANVALARMNGWIKDNNLISQAIVIKEDTIKDIPKAKGDITQDATIVSP